MEKVHLIAIGGSAMHNMALALHEKGFIVSGSDDEINEPSKSRLAKAGILPEKIGWFPEKITSDINSIILGMHARADNPELLRAKELGLKIYSYPEYIYEATKNKTRIVIGGSHGKTTITAMILHVMLFYKIETDFLVGAQLAGFDTMVNLTNTSKFAVIEGDEYLASPIDRRPKFHLYKPNIAIISGIAWDHINVFPTFENYVEQFTKFINLIEPKGYLIYCSEDKVLEKICQNATNNEITKIPYAIPKNEIENGTTNLLVNEHKIPLEIFGNHNLMNLNGGRLVCNTIGISDEKFYEAIKSFKGAAKRLELVFKNKDFNFYKDFAHSPSKLKATTDAVKKQFTNRYILACMELHTFSSLNEEFLNEYKGSMDLADEAIVYFNPHTIAHKKLKEITIEQVEKAFNRKNLKVFTKSIELTDYLKSKNWANKVLLMMSSGNFDGIDFNGLAKELTV
ncbi:MAG: Mur ligase family protein [Bacteroidota bacterium]|nr:Mur ligase family protein [Bacteroidota bacterium]MDP3144631.1 Mur ligase family protein [Bacteroidota bacterium]MDP3556570.1 Mur ligase family protein [Bacteroidota bacterium]